MLKNTYSLIDINYISNLINLQWRFVILSGDTTTTMVGPSLNHVNNHDGAVSPSGDGCKDGGGAQNVSTGNMSTANMSTSSIFDSPGDDQRPSRRQYSNRSKLSIFVHSSILFIDVL